MCLLPSGCEFPQKAQAGQDLEQHKQKIIDQNTCPFLSLCFRLNLQGHHPLDHLEGELSPLQPAKHQTNM